MPICSKKHPPETKHCYKCGDCVKEPNPHAFHTKWGEQYFCSVGCRIKVMFPNSSQ